MGGARGIGIGLGRQLPHQGDTIFATWFTYDARRQPHCGWWRRRTLTAVGVYAGTLLRTTGPAFNAMPFDPAEVVATPVGTATLTFADGNDAMFAYTVNGVSQTKSITRQVFRAPGTVCSAATSNAVVSDPMMPPPPGMGYPPGGGYGPP